MDVFSCYTWGFKLKHHGTAKHTVDALNNITQSFHAPETLMTDGGSHFNNAEVCAWCTAHKAEHCIVAAYAPWINGLVENANGLLLGRLCRLCSLGVREDETHPIILGEEDRAWPNHFDAAIRQLNERIIPSLRFSPKELLLRLIINTTRTPENNMNAQPQPSDINIHFAYASQQRLDATDCAVLHTTRRKAAFDRSVLSSPIGEVVFAAEQLVQVYDSARETTLATSRKLRPQWSAPHRVSEWIGNSYKLTTLEGFPLPGLYHARRLRRFFSNEGSALAAHEEKHHETTQGPEENNEEQTEFSPNPYIESEDEELETEVGIEKGFG